MEILDFIKETYFLSEFQDAFFLNLNDSLNFLSELFIIINNPNFVTFILVLLFPYLPLPTLSLPFPYPYPTRYIELTEVELQAVDCEDNEWVQLQPSVI